MKTYIVGGFVRDTYMGKTPKDIDYVVVGSSAQEMLSLGYQQVGADFPVFLHPKTGDEHALARVERKTGNGYLGFSVDTENVTLEEDLSRRDFTCGAMALDPDTKEIIDPFGGRYDIDAGILDIVGPTFSEDPLRVIRAARFLCRYNWKPSDRLEKLSVQMIEDGMLNDLATERYWAEIEKVMTEEKPWIFFEYLYKWGAFDKVKFFKTLFSKNLSIDIIKNLLIDASVMVSYEKMVTVFCGIVGQDMAAIKPTAEITLLSKNIVQMQHSKKTVDDIFKLLKAIRVIGEGPAFNNFYMAIGVMSYYLPTLISREELHQFQLAYASVKAEQFPHLQNKELGVAMDEKRKQLLKDTGYFKNERDNPI